MKKIYTLILAFLCFFAQSQPYSSLLKDANWTVTKIQYNGIDYYPPIPFTQSGKVAFGVNTVDGFQSTFYNNANGKVTFGANNATYFTLQNIVVTLGEYYGVNEQLVREFDAMTNYFYVGFQPTDPFNFQYEQVFSGKNLIVTNKNGNKIFYSTLILGNSEVAAGKITSIYPNPAKNEVFLKSSENIFGKVNVEIFDDSGKLVSQKKISHANSFDVRMLQNGVYTVKLTHSGIDYSFRLLIEK